MKAAVIRERGATPVYADFPDPVVGDGQAEVELIAAGIHNVARSRVSGRHYSFRGGWPAVPGVDAVARTSDGRLVYTGFVEQPWGTMAQRMAVPAQFGMPLPDGADPLAVAAGMNPGLASWIPLSQRADELGDRPLGTVLVLGATGMAGGIAIDNAYALGADAVVAVGRNEEQLAAIRQRHGDGDLRTVAIGDGSRLADDLAAALAGRPPRTVIDLLWGPVAETTFAVLGRPELETEDYDVGYVQIGSMAGDPAAVPSALLRSRNLRLTGSGLGGTPMAEILTRLPAFLAQIADGRVHIPYVAYPLSEIAQAWAAPSHPRAVVVPD